MATAAWNSNTAIQLPEMRHDAAPSAGGNAVQELIAVLCRARALTLEFCDLLRREFDFVRALSDWEFKLRLLRAMLRSLEAKLDAMEDADRSGSSLANELKLSRMYLAYAFEAIEVSVESFPRNRLPHFEERDDRPAVEQGADVIFQVLRDVTFVSDLLENWEVELGLNDPSPMAELIPSIRLPSHVGNEPAAVVNVAIKDCRQSLPSDNAPLICMATRHLYLSYCYALAIEPGEWASTELYQRVVELHDTAYERTKELADSNPRRFEFPDPVVRQCLESIDQRRKQLRERLSPHALFNYLSAVYEERSMTETCEKQERQFVPAFRDPDDVDLPRIIIVGEPGWTGPIDDQLASDFIVESITPEELCKETRVDRFDLAILSRRALSNTGIFKAVLADDPTEDVHSASGEVGQLAARVVVLCKQDEPLPRGAPPEWRPSCEPPAQVDRHFVWVFLTGGTSKDWRDKALTHRRRTALIDLAAHWIVRAMLEDCYGDRLKPDYTRFADFLRERAKLATLQQQLLKSYRSAEHSQTQGLESELLQESVEILHLMAEYKPSQYQSWRTQHKLGKAQGFPRSPFVLYGDYGITANSLKHACMQLASIK